MKKYLIFALCFIILFTIFEVLSGMLLTLLYTPDVSEAWNTSVNLSQEVFIIGNNSSFLVTLFLALLSASIAYVIQNKFTGTRTTNK